MNRATTKAIRKEALPQTKTVFFQNHIILHCTLSVYLDLIQTPKLDIASQFTVLCRSLLSSSPDGSSSCSPHNTGGLLYNMSASSCISNSYHGAMPFGLLGILHSQPQCDMDVFSPCFHRLHRIQCLVLGVSLCRGVQSGALSLKKEPWRGLQCLIIRGIQAPLSRFAWMDAS